MKDILAVMGAVYTRSEIYEWVNAQIKNKTQHYQDATMLQIAYNLHIREPWNRRYMIVRTADYPKSASANGNRDGEYMLRRVSPKRMPRQKPPWYRTAIHKYGSTYYSYDY